MEKSKTPCVVFTGVTGMLGKAFAKAAGGRYKVAGVSRRGSDGGHACDLSDERQVEALFKKIPDADLVIHAAAYSDVDGCERDPQTAHRCNVTATQILSQACAARKIPWIYVSTDYVFDGLKDSPYVEDDPTGPVDIYGLTKLGGEFYAWTSGVSSVIVRTSWLFGSPNPANFVNAILGRLKSEKKVEVLADQTDCPTGVQDLSEALMKIGDRLMREHRQASARPRHDIFHVCNAGPTTRYEMTLYLKELLGCVDVQVEKAGPLQMKNRLAVRPSYAVMSARRYEDVFRTTLRPWRESLKEYVKGLASCAS